MPLFIEKPTIITLEVDIKPDASDAFVNWQSDFNTKIVNAPGFVSLEFSSPAEEKNRWVIVQRFSDATHAHDFSNSDGYNQLLAKLKALTANSELKIDQGEESSHARNVTELIVTEVQPGMEENYREWSSKIHRSEAKFPGFRGVYVQSPKGTSKHWITSLQFDTTENLERWLQSSERKQVLAESSPFISSVESHRMISPFAGWFASLAKTGVAPALWKQTMIILLVLFPIVLLELRYLNPLTAPLHPSLSTFIGNAISVSLISFPMMPIAIWFLGWWLSANDLKTNILGTLIVGFLYIITILLGEFYILPPMAAS
jgi:antibiotic biosynthesis monooxygenase (ABM) superfamily enzyme